MLLRCLEISNQKQVYFPTSFNYSTSALPGKTRKHRNKSFHVRPDRLLVKCEKCAQHLMVSARVYWDGKSRLLIVEEKARVNADYTVIRLLPELIAGCIFCPQTSLPAGRRPSSHGARHAGLAANELSCMVH